ncbi:hypothetical protein BH24ACT3_BH24ACT3_17180 [soil metagenome]
MQRGVNIAEVQGWFAGRLPDAWFVAGPTVRADREELLVIGTLAEPKVADGDPEGLSAVDARRVAWSARIEGFREDTRELRMRIADEAEHLWGRKVSWGARCGELERRFTVASVPVMTRLRLDERSVLDTLIEAGVARSRSEALAWCVRLVGRNQAEWITELRTAVETVDQVRAGGPTLE